MNLKCVVISSGLTCRFIQQRELRHTVHRESEASSDVPWTASSYQNKALVQAVAYNANLFEFFFIYKVSFICEILM